MKKYLACILALVLMMSIFTACSDSAAPAGNDAAEAAGDTAADSAGDGGTDAGTSNDGDQVRVYLVMAARDEFLSTLEAAATDVANSMGVEFSVADAQNDTSKMIQFVETARNGGYDAVIVNLVDPNNAPEVIEAAGDMKVVFVNRIPTDESVFNENCIYVGSDETQAGRFQGEYLAAYFQERDMDEIRYILLNGPLGGTNTILRTESVLETLEEMGITAIEATAPLACDWDRATAMDKMSPLIGTTEFDCVISNNDAMALGVIEAFDAQGVDPSSVPIVGVDATADGRQAIKDGTLAMSAFQNPVGQGNGSINAAVNMVLGNPINQNTEYDIEDYIMWVPFELVTPENVAEYDDM